MNKEKQVKVIEEELKAWEIIAFVLISVFFFIGICFVTVSISDAFREINNVSKPESEHILYQEAVEYCGETNIKRISYKDGSTDFSCEDYSLVEKNDD